MKRITITIGLTIAALLCPTATAEQGDALDEALATVGLQRADLGWRPKGYWARFPAQIPYKLRLFDDLFAEPLATIPFTRTMGRSARMLLDPETLDDEGRESAGMLFRAVHALGIEPKYGGNRSYSANLTAEPTPLVEAILRMYDAADRATTFVTFGDESPYPKTKQKLAEAVAVIPADAQPILGELIVNLLDADRWAHLALRNVPLADRVVIAQRLDIGVEQVDALEYCPQFDDAARVFDEASMWYAGLKCVQALDDARKQLAELDDPPDFAFSWRAPQGWVRITGSGADIVDGDDAWLIVDLGGDDTYTGGVAASTALRPMGILLDMAGHDVYLGGRTTQGAGMCGIGILLDVAGDDTYSAETHAQGVGQFGLGVCIDLAGNDDYFARYSSQGCGYFGVGLLMDIAGDDDYTLHADGQGLGGVAGVGVLVDRMGNDWYEAVRDAAVTGRPSYHSGEKVSVSNAQGCAMGRRGDGADGHCWAGGLGALIDVEGSDQYIAGNWSQGCGYWFGMGALYDGSGDDAYHGVVWSQASGAHFCIGVLLDEGGDDLHVAEENATNSLAFGHDFTIAILANLGGDDRYIIENNGLGQSINRSVAMLIDIGGNDEYLGQAANRPGLARYDESRLLKRDGVSTYFADTTSVGLFLDVGGDDSYGIAQPDAKRHLLLPLDDEPTSDDPDDSAAQGMLGCKDNSIWLDPPDSPNNAVRNFSVGVDRADGAVSFLPIPEKPVSSSQPVDSQERR
ncbi:MAG: hypothetical protein KAS72_09480 [Phycisphaerales bacterium]|nr:hypothetical protein [Phycisphaerales bacterium]